MAATRTKLKTPVVYDMTSQECIWSSAGLAPYRLCHNAFDCTSCTFDRGMLRKGVRKDWQQLAREQADQQKRRCRHMIAGYVSAKYCANNFDCANCEYDQMVEEEMRSRCPDQPTVQWVAGFGLAADHYYCGAHTWARVEYGGQVRIGLDDFGARLLGPADRCQLAALGTALAPNQPSATLVRDGQIAQLACPLEGIVVACNPHLEAQPELLSSSPYEDGWLMIVQPTKLLRNLRQLFFGEGAQAWLDSEAARLSAMVHRESSYPLAATGGQAIPDIYGAVPGLDWEEMCRTFFQVAEAQ